MQLEKPDQTLKPVTLSEVDLMVKTLRDLEGKMEALERDVVEPLRKEIQGVKLKLLHILEEQKLKSFKSQHGTVTRVETYKVKIPKDTEDKKKYMEFLKSKGGEDLMWAHTHVNYQQANSFYKEQRDIAVEEGNFGFEVPGVGAPELFTHLSLKKGS